MVSEMMMSTYAMCCTACAFFKSSDMTKVCTYQDAFEKTGNATFIETATTLKESWVWPDARARYAYAAAGVSTLPFFALVRPEDAIMFAALTVVTSAAANVAASFKAADMAQANTAMATWHLNNDPADLQEAESLYERWPGDVVELLKLIAGDTLRAITKDLFPVINEILSPGPPVGFLLNLDQLKMVIDKRRNINEVEVETPTDPDQDALGPAQQMQSKAEPEE